MAQTMVVSEPIILLDKHLHVQDHPFKKGWGYGFHLD